MNILRTYLIIIHSFRASHLRSYRANTYIESYHTLNKLSFWIKVAINIQMFGPLTHTTCIRQILKMLYNPRKLLKTDICNVIPPFSFFFDLPMVLTHREVINPFPDLTTYYFCSEDVIFILSRLTKFKEICKLMNFSPS